MEDMKKKISLLESQLAIKTKEIESLRKANKSSAVAIQRCTKLLMNYRCLYRYNIVTDVH